MIHSLYYLNRFSLIFRHAIKFIDEQKYWDYYYTIFNRNTFESPYKEKCTNFSAPICKFSLILKKHVLQFL